MDRKVSCDRRIRSFQHNLCLPPMVNRNTPTTLTIQCIFPSLVHAKMNRPMGSRNEAYNAGIRRRSSLPMPCARIESFTLRRRRLIMIRSSKGGGLAAAPVRAAFMNTPSMTVQHSQSISIPHHTESKTTPYLMWGAPYPFEC